MKRLKMTIYYVTPKYPHGETGIYVTVCSAETEIGYVQDHWKQLIADEGQKIPEDAILTRYSVDCRG